MNWNSKHYGLRVLNLVVVKKVTTQNVVTLECVISVSIFPMFSVHLLTTAINLLLPK